MLDFVSAIIFENLLQLGSYSLSLFLSAQEEQYFFTAQKSLGSVVVDELDTGDWGLPPESHVMLGRDDKQTLIRLGDNK